VGVPRPEPWWEPRPLTAAALAVGLAITAVLSWAAFTANDRSTSSLLQLQARQTASTLSAALPGIESQLADALTVAVDTGSPATFDRFVSNHIAGVKLASVSLWQRTAGGTAMLTHAFSEPRLASEGSAGRAFLASIAPSSTLQVTGILAGSPPRVGYALYEPNPAGYIVYGESDLPPGKRITVPPSSPYHQLGIALYLGSRLDASHLIESSVPTPITGTRATVAVPFGDTVLTLVATPRRPLAPTSSRILPWIALAGGLALTLASATVAGYLTRRRRHAEALSDRLAALYAEQRSVAETLQHSLLPQALPSVPGVEIAARYLPGAEGVDIGGDWYDVVLLGGDRFAFVVGDVSGRGVRAASVMASLRFAARGFALEGHGPATILGHLARTLDFASEGCFATVLCGVIDTGRRQMVLANAGHLPPIVLHDGTAAVVEVPPGPPIGVADGAPTERTVALPAGVVVVAYTDGLVERRGESLDAAIERLERAASGPSTSVDDLLDRLLGGLGANAPADDVAVLGIGIP
jgi:hypothetical protein